MKKVSLLILVSLILLLAFASCDYLPDSVKEMIGIDTHEHVWSDATCESPKTCECGETEGEALGHSWSEATCTSPKTCTVCKATDGSAAGHDYADATCTAPKTCKDCGNTVGQALGHNWSAADCTTPATCTVCQATNGVANGHQYQYECDAHCMVCHELTNEEAAHSMVHVPAVDATCTEYGNIEYYYCEICGYCWENADATGAQLNQKTVQIEPGHAYRFECDAHCMNCGELTNPNAAHSTTKVDAVEATCTEDGNVEYYVCSICNGCWLDAELTQNTNAKSVVVPAAHQYQFECDAHCMVCKDLTNPDASHTLTHVEAVAPTCSSTGNVEYYICNYCGTAWDNADATGMPLNRKSVILPMVDHSYRFECDAHCMNCGELTNPDAQHTASKVEAVAPTCTTNGNVEYYVCSVCNGCWLDAELIFSTNAMSIVLPAAHSMVDATCDTPAICSECGYTEGEALGHDMAPATCDEPSTCLNGCGLTEGDPIANHTPTATYAEGHITYTCTTCYDVFTTEQELIYDGDQDIYFSKNGDITLEKNNGQYDVVAGGDRAQYMLYFPSNDKNHKDSLTGFNAENGAFGALSFRIKMNVALKNEAVRIIVMSARNNPNWDANGAWSGNSIDILAFMPNFDGDTFNGTYRVYGNSMTSNTFATVNADEWVDVKMFMQFSPEGVLSISYYINGQFCNVYTRDCSADIAEVGMAIKNLDINCAYICGYAGAGTGLSLDDFYMGYAAYTEWLFDEHDHVWVDATCTDAKYCSACGLTEGEALGHTPADAVSENVDLPTCVLPGSHDEVVYCATCQAEISRKSVTDAALGHTDETVSGYAATCTEPGLTDGTVCSVCGTTTLAQVAIPATGHKDENSDLVCDNCSTDLACKHEGETEVVTGRAPTCTEPGLTNGTKCLVCGDIFEGYETIPATDHVNAAAVRENVTAPTCTTDGKYDSVVYCSVCSVELTREKNVVDPQLGHNEVSHDAKAPTCTEKGWDAYVTCTRCDYSTQVLKDTIAHNYTAETCAQAKTCTVCGKTAGDVNPNAHNLVVSYANATPTYTCTICEYSFTPKTFDYSDGTNYNGLHCNASTNNNVYTTNGSNYPVQTNGYLEFVRTDVNAGESKQVQIWVPSANGGTNKFSGFTAASNSVGYLSFKVSANIDHNFEMTLVDNRVDNLDLDGDGAAESIRWADPWRIAAPVFAISTVSDGYATLKGFQNNLVSVAVDENGYTPWINVAIQITLDPNTDKVIAAYYIDGNYIATYSVALTTHTDAIQAVYINSNNKAAGTGYKLDDFTFGYSAHSHDFDVEYADTLTYTCACGATYTLENEFLKWDGEGDNAIKNVPNGTVELKVNEDGQYEYIFNPATDVAPDFSASGTQSQDGWYEYDTKGYAGGQLQMWMPSNNRGENTFADFSCENNAVGVISFSMSSSLARHPDFDTSLTFSVGKPRNASDWNDGGSWADDSINIFTVEEYQDSGVVLKGGLNGTNLNLITIPAANGWSEWFDVMIVIEMTDDGYITVYYYINGALLGSDSRDLNNPGGYRTLNPKMIEALQVSGWTYVPDTGVKFDNFYFGYTVGGHNIFDGQVHKTTPATCESVASCVCGWAGSELGHEFAVPCAPTCSLCGEANTNANAHNLLPDGDKFTCTVCNGHYVIDNSVIFDGDEDFYYSKNGAMPLNKVDGVYEAIFSTETPKPGDDQIPVDGNGKPVAGGLVKDENGQETGWAWNNGFGAQHMFWIPNNSAGTGLSGFSCENNSVGLLSFKMQTNVTSAFNISLAKARGDADWSGWGTSELKVLQVGGYSASGIVLKGGVGAGTQIAVIPVADGWSEWFQVDIVITLTDNNRIALDYYINGEYIQSFSGAMTIDTYDVRVVYINGWTYANNTGIKLDDIVFGCVASDFVPYVEPFYTEEIAKEDVASSVLQTVVTNKMKQWDQSEAHNSHNGTPVFVKADKNGEEVTGVYFSKTTPWVGDEGEQFSEFRVMINGEAKTGPQVTGFSFSYKVDGTVDKNLGSGNGGYTFTDLQGNKFEADAYVQIKTAANHPLAGDNYPELSGTDLVLDGEWHEMTITFDEPLQLTNILFNLYHFQGELIIADLVVNYAE